MFQKSVGMLIGFAANYLHKTDLIHIREETLFTLIQPLVMVTLRQK